MRPLVSIVIANFNYARFLGEAIESAQQQGYPNIEILCIDDGSTDDSLAVACRYNVTVLAQENQGVCAARNNAAALARGKYILFLDADDRLFPDAVEKLVSLVERSGPDFGFAYGQMQYFGQRDSLFASRPFDPQALARENFISACSLIRKSVFDAVGGWDRGFKLREDWELFVRIWHAGYRGAFLAEPHLHYRKHKEPTRKKTRTPKNIVMARLIYLYPRFFIRKLLKKPLRYLYYRWRYGAPGLIRQYGPSANPPRRIK